ncbi:murein hydrolase activator EnvC family protein [Plantactinospora sp. GCM10030261]|uniref:murein hydrolase activator EnvC family protein n=1 Tax=Plantactinospora sp. GCM10030261 TaxID=3273420 RepID=UPI0036151008
MPILVRLVVASVLFLPPMPGATPAAVAASDTARSTAAAVGSATVPADAVPAAGGFRWPLDGTPRLVRRFDPPPRRWSPGHRGVDLAAPAGSVVRAAGPGVVAFAGMVAGRPVMSLRHANGLRTTYEPVDAGVQVGEPVAAGTPIGRLRSGHPGCPVPACLHWGLRSGAAYLDPLGVVGLGRVRLLPVGPP